MDKTWSSALLDMFHYGTKTKGYRNVFVVIDNLTEYGLGIPLQKILEL